MNIKPFWETNINENTVVNSNISAFSEGSVSVDFSFFAKDDAKKMSDGTDGTE